MILTSNRQIGLQSVNNVTDTDDIRQCIYVILTAIKGSVPFNPSFGCDLYNYLDKPVSDMIPAAKKAIIDAIEMFEPRVIVQSVQHRFESGKVEFDINMTRVDTNEVIQYALAPLANIELSQTRLFTLIITVNEGLRYFVSLSINGVEFSGLEYGYETITALWDWINENWINLGNWHLLQTRDQILLYVLANSASLNLTKLVGTQALFPPLSNDEFYIVRFGDRYSIDGLKTKDAVLLWVSENWADLGKWMTDGKYLILSTTMLSPDLEIFPTTVGDFNEDFDNNFSI